MRGVSFLDVRREQACYECLKCVDVMPRNPVPCPDDYNGLRSSVPVAEHGLQQSCSNLLFRLEAEHLHIAATAHGGSDRRIAVAECQVCCRQDRVCGQVPAKQPLLC